MIEGVRFDLYYNGNKHDAGILAKLNDTGIYRNEELEHELSRILRVINARLPVPDYYNLGEDNEAFFTPQGFDYFASYMHDLAELIAKQNNGWQAVMRREVIVADRILYDDGLQIIASKIEDYEEELA